MLTPDSGRPILDPPIVVMSVKFITVWIFTLALFCACGLGHEQEPSPRFTIDTPARTLSGCTLIALEENGTLQVEHSAARVALPRFIEIRQEEKKLPPLMARSFVSLSNGDRLPIDAEPSARLEESRLHLCPGKSLPVANAKGLDLFVPNVVLLFWSLPEGVDEAERFFTQLQGEQRKRDVVFLQNGDRIEGTIAALGPKIGCVITTDGRKVQTPWAKLAGIAWSTDRQARLRTKKSYIRAVLEGGARVNFLELRFEAKVRRWVGKTQFGATVELSESNLIALDVRQGLAVDVSELTPARYEHRPFLGAVWPLAKDAAATGRPLRLNGSTYEKGLGTHAACQVAYKLDGHYQRFDALVGIDETSRRGRARAAIDLDGKRIELNEGKELTSQSVPLAVQLDVSNVHTMTLIVELGSFGDVQADLNWAKARLIKKESESTKAKK